MLVKCNKHEHKENTIDIEKDNQDSSMVLKISLKVII